MAVKQDIKDYFFEKLNIRFKTFCSGSTRKNLKYKVFKVENEDEKYGNHYHCMLPEWNSKHSESGKAKEVVHYYAGQIMPEPWASWYKGY